MVRISKEKLAVADARLRFIEASEALSARRIIKDHPLATTGSVFALGFLLRKVKLGSPFSLISLANLLIRRL
jgi:hypothetical protein